jgi:hypothetical protein
MRRSKKRFSSSPLIVLVVCVAAVLLVAASACQRAPVPPEVLQVESLDEDIRRVGAPVYAPDEYRQYLDALVAARVRLAQENERWSLLRNYRETAGLYRAAVAKGEALRERVRLTSEAKKVALTQRIEKAREENDVLREVTTLMNEGREGRRNLTRAQVLLDDAGRAVAQGKFNEADVAVSLAEVQHTNARKTLGARLDRYMDSRQIAAWNDIFDAAVCDSSQSGGLLLVVLKLDRKLLLYRDGRLVNTYPVGIGMNGLSDKLFSGDRATPEGRYQISKKISNSRYYRALLINYPNEEDRHRFANAQKRGLIPRGRGIGNAVEIHGGGRDSVTEGCVSVDNNIMDKLYSMVEAGTPVVIVGTLEADGRIAEACRKRK